jgi:hypothetical protein
VHDVRVPASELLDARLPSSAATARAQTQSADLDLATPPIVSPLDTSRPLCAEALIQRDALRHFPTAFVITARGIHPHAVVGAMPWNAWVSSLDQRLKQL